MKVFPELQILNTFIEFSLITVMKLQSSYCRDLSGNFSLVGRKRAAKVSDSVNRGGVTTTPDHECLLQHPKHSETVLLASACYPSAA